MHSQSKLNWLEGILTKRLHSSLKIRSSNNSLFITIDNLGKKIEIESKSVLFQPMIYEFPCANWNYDNGTWSSLIKDFLPAPGYSDLDDFVIVKTKFGYKIKYDILGLVYWMLSRQEEVGRKDLDSHGRFPAVASHAFKHDYLERPIVDEWVDILRQVMIKVWPTVKFRTNQFQIKISHDVDIPSRYIFRGIYGLIQGMAGDVLKRGNIYNALSAPWSYIKTHRELPKNDPINTFEWIMDQSDKYNLKSAFYFICGKTHPETDADYDVSHPAMRSLIRKIHKRGHEVGLHPTYNACHTPGAIVDEARRLSMVCNEENIKQKKWGARMHYLRWSHPHTMYNLKDAGMDYDSTLGYADHAGFRCGTCYEYPAFDPIADRKLNLTIRPLVAMDVTIAEYMGLGFTSSAYNKLTELKKACKSVNGTFTLLWHNNQLETKQAKELYISILE